MTLLLSSRASREEAIDLLRKVIHTFMFPHLTMVQRDAIMEHITWMKSQRTEMGITCRLETVPELHLTRLVVEATQGRSHDPH